MADNTAIEWTDATWNPITGCSVVSPGCTNCYAMRMAGTRLKNTPSRKGLTTPSKAGPVWNGQVRLNADQLTQPLRWKRPRKIFVCAHGDLFHESVPDAWIDQVFAVMALSPQHTFQVLTKRAARMREYVNGPWQGRLIPHLQRMQNRPAGYGALLKTRDGVLPNVWLGVSAEDQARADERIPELLATPAAVRLLSAEPLLSGLDIAKYMHDTVCRAFDEKVCTCSAPREAALDWVIVGGESGPGARPMHPDWARQIRDDCAAAGVAFFFKQWGAWKEAFHDADGPNVDEVDVGSEAAESFASLVPPDRRAFLTADGRCFHRDADIPAATPARLMEHLGKKAAGRRLDGVEHSAMPEPCQ